VERQPLRDARQLTPVALAALGERLDHLERLVGIVGERLIARRAVEAWRGLGHAVVGLRAERVVVGAQRVYPGGNKRTVSEGSLSAAISARTSQPLAIVSLKLLPGISLPLDVNMPVQSCSTTPGPSSFGSPIANWSLPCERVNATARA